MKENSNIKNLKEKVILLSKSPAWMFAKEEWSLYKTYHNEEGRHCACGHHINNVCVIRNINNGNLLEVGLVCLKKFNSNKFGNLNSIKFKVDIKAKLVSAYNNKRISGWEYDFMLSLANFKSLSAKQKEVRDKILKKIGK